MGAALALSDESVDIARAAYEALSKEMTASSERLVDRDTH